MDSLAGSAQGIGCLYVRRDVYERIQLQQLLPLTNEEFGRLLMPFFEPMTVRPSEGDRSLVED